MHTSVDALVWFECYIVCVSLPNILFFIKWIYCIVSKWEIHSAVQFLSQNLHCCKMSSKKLVTCKKRLEINSNKMLCCSSLYSESVHNFKTEFTVCELTITNSQPKRKAEEAYFEVIPSHIPAQPVCVELHCLNISDDWLLSAVNEAEPKHGVD